MQHKGTKAANAGCDFLAVFWVQSNFAGEGQQLQCFWQIHFVGNPAFWNACTSWFFLGVFFLFAHLDVGTKATAFEPDVLIGFRVFP